MKGEFKIQREIDQRKKIKNKKKEQQILVFIEPNIACFLFLNSLAQINYPPLKK